MCVRTEFVGLRGMLLTGLDRKVSGGYAKLRWISDTKRKNAEFGMEEVNRSGIFRYLQYCTTVLYVHRSL